MSQSGFAGTWKLNLAQSEVPPVTKSQVLIIETDGVEVSMREELVNDKDELLVSPSRANSTDVTILSLVLRLPTRYHIACWMPILLKE